jgi:cobalt-zinc-cadmium efflux system outer membrane protein
MRRFCHAILMAVLFLRLALGVCAQETGHQEVPGGTRIERLPLGAHSPDDTQRNRGAIGSKPGSMRPRVPMNQTPRAPAHPGLPPLEIAPQSIPIPNSWSILFEIHDDGPPNGLSLDQAIERLVGASVALKAKSLDIPQAQADVLTAGLHANPIVYGDGQLLPYKHYNAVTNPGGTAQYDLNVAYPLDLSGKRPARVDVANAAQRVTEAMYQDAVRQEVDRLGTVFVDALAARLAVRTLRGGLTRIEEIQKRAAQENRDPREAEALRHQIQIQRQTIALALVDAEAAWRNSRRTLCMMLNLPRENVAQLDLRGTVEDRILRPPSVQDLVTTALANRPDIAAYRLGVQRAEADFRLSKANRLPDVYALYQPLTYQDNAPFNAPSSRSWAPAPR